MAFGSPEYATPFAQRSKGARRSSAQREPSPSRSPARRDALGRRAAAGVPDSQSASERGGSAKREKPPRTRLASSGGQLTQRSERDARRAQARAALERNEALVWERKIGRFSKTSRAGSCRAEDNISRRQRAKPNAPNLCRQRQGGEAGELRAKGLPALACRALDDSSRREISWIALLSISVRPACTSFRVPNGYGPAGRLRSLPSRKSAVADFPVSRRVLRA